MTELRNYTHYIHLDPSNIQQGDWCDRCNAGTCVTYDVVTANEYGVSVLGHGVLCPRCDGEEDEEP